MIGAIISAIAFMVMMVMLDYSFEGKAKKYYEMIDGEVFPQAIMFGLAVGVAHYLAGVLSGGLMFIAPIAMLGLIVMAIYLATWYSSSTTKVWEFFVFLLLEALVFSALRGMANVTVNMLSNQAWVKSVIDAMISILSLACATTGLIGLLKFKNVSSGWVTFVKFVAIVLLIANIVSAFAFGFTTKSVQARATGAGQQVTVEPKPNHGSVTTGLVEEFFNRGTNQSATGSASTSFGVQPSPTPSALPTQVPLTAMDGESTLTGIDLSNAWYGFYNAFMQKDNDPSNDYNFGHDPTKSGWKAADFDRDFRERISHDPALGAADMAWADIMLKTSVSGVKVGKSLDEWMVNINEAKERFMLNQVSYNECTSAFFKLLDAAESVEVRTYSGVKTQMFMNPHTRNGVPYVVIMEINGDNGGTFLCYTFNMKGVKVELFYRIPCGYQPCNVVEPVNIVIEAGGNGPDPVTPTAPPTAPPTVPPITPPYHKDPTQGTDVGVNDVWGPGPDTNVGVGGWWSAVQPPVSSTDEGSYQDYQETINDMAGANIGGQSEGGAPNIPTYEPPVSSTIDNNADSGTGFGGIDVGTTVAETHIDVGGGNEVAISTEGPAGSWGGPPD